MKKWNQTAAGRKRQSELMQASWKKRKQAAAKQKVNGHVLTKAQEKLAVAIPQTEAEKKMAVRVISHQEGTEIERVGINTWGELVDLVLGYETKGIALSEVLIEVK